MAAARARGDEHRRPRRIKVGKSEIRVIEGASRLERTVAESQGPFGAFVPGGGRTRESLSPAIRDLIDEWERQEEAGS